MSRADQSLSSTAPNTCQSAWSTAIRVDVGPPTRKPTSSSMSRARAGWGAGGRRGVGQADGRAGRSTSVPPTRSRPARGRGADVGGGASWAAAARRRRDAVTTPVAWWIEEKKSTDRVAHPAAARRYRSVPSTVGAFGWRGARRRVRAVVAASWRGAGVGRRTGVVSSIAGVGTRSNAGRRRCRRIDDSSPRSTPTGELLVAVRAGTDADTAAFDVDVAGNAPSVSAASGCGTPRRSWRLRRHTSASGPTATRWTAATATPGGAAARSTPGGRRSRRARDGRGR